MAQTRWWQALRKPTRLWHGLTHGRHSLLLLLLLLLLLQQRIRRLGLLSAQALLQ